MILAYPCDHMVKWKTLNQQWVLIAGNTKVWSLLQRTAYFLFFPWLPICLSKSQDVSGNDHTHFGAAQKHFGPIMHILGL
jgi:hypothetical protein